MAIQDPRRAIVSPNFGKGASVEEQLSRLQSLYSQLAQQLSSVHNDLQTEEFLDVAGGNMVFVFTWQSPWPSDPVTYKVFASFTWQTTYAFARSADGTQVTITTAVASGAGDRVQILGVA
jgi:hypothetical protein